MEPQATCLWCMSAAGLFVAQIPPNDTYLRAFVPACLAMDALLWARRATQFGTP
jgi:hypothetical protein